MRFASTPPPQSNGCFSHPFGAKSISVSPLLHNAVYVALAEILAAPLLTRDGKMASAAGQIESVLISEVTAFNVSQATNQRIHSNSKANPVTKLNGFPCAIGFLLPSRRRSTGALISRGN